MSAVAAERGVAVAGDVVDSVIVTGDHATINLHVGSRSGAVLELLHEAVAIRPLPLPVRDRPARRPDHVGREAETARLFDDERVVSVHGDAGIGKTYLLVHAGWSDRADAVRDGVVYVFARGKTRVELLQELFEAFHESDAPIKRSERQLQRDLTEREALLLLDAVDLDGEELQALVGALPAARFVVAAEERRLWEGGFVALRGLPPEEALALVEHELGRELEAVEREEAIRLCGALDGHPQRIRRAVAEGRAEGRPLAEIASVRELPLRLSDDERAVLAALAAAGGDRVGESLLSRLAGVSDLRRVIAELERRRLVTAHSPRWSLAPGIADRLMPADVPAARAAAWAEDHRKAPGTVVEDATSLLVLLRAARREGRDADAIRLGRALAPALAWGRRWDSWQETVDTVLAAARRANDRAAEGWALNDRGAHAFTVGDDAGAKDALLAALEVREELGDPQDVAVSRHNLRIVTGPPPPPQPDGWPEFPKWLATAAAVVVAAGIFAGGVGAWRLLSGGGAADASVVVDVEGPGRVVSDPAGIDCPGDCEADFAGEAEVLLAAGPDEGATLTGWEGGDCADAPGTTCRLAGGEARSARAVFHRGSTTVAARAVLEVVAAGGRVVSRPRGIACPGACSADYATGANIELEAVPDERFRFAGWRGACADDSNPVCEVTLERDLAVVARFDPLPGGVELRVDPPNGGRIGSEPAGIECPERCVASFAEGAAVVLTAAPDEGFAFAAWTGACEDADGATCTLALDEPRVAGARFDPVPGTVDLVVVPAEGGTVSSDPAGISCPETCSATFTAGTQVTLAATAAAGFRHAGWTGACDEVTGPSCVLTVEESTEAGALFEPLATLTVRVRGGRVVSTPTGIDCTSTCRAGFAAGSEVTLAAEPSTPGELTSVKWAGACAQAEGTSCTLRVTGNAVASASISVRD